MESYKKTIKYFSRFPFYNSMVHLSLGLSIGILIARPMDQGHPIKLAFLFGAIAILGHLMPILVGKK